MDSIVQIIREIVRDELRSLHIGELGTVTSVFPIDSESSPDTHACSVHLRDRDIELPSVPIATPYIGLVSCPQIGDLVLLTFVGGDQNDPIVIGRLHSDQHRPPIHEDGELAIEAPYGGSTRMSFMPDGSFVVQVADSELRMDAENNISLTGAALTVNCDGDVQLTATGDLQASVDGEANISVQGNTTLETADCSIKASGNIDLGEGGAGVITAQTHKCFFTGAPLIGSLTVTSKG